MDWLCDRNRQMANNIHCKKRVSDKYVDKGVFDTSHPNHLCVDGFLFLCNSPKGKPPTRMCKKKRKKLLKIN